MQSFLKCSVILPTVHWLVPPSPSQPLPQFPAEAVRTFPGSLEGCVLNADMDAQLGGNIFPASKDSGFTSTRGQFTSCILSAPLTMGGFQVPQLPSLMVGVCEVLLTGISLLVGDRTFVD